MKPQPQDWTRFADIQAVAMTHAQPRRAAWTGAPRLVERLGSQGNGAPAATTAPNSIAPPVAMIVAALLALITLCGLLSWHLGYDFRGLLLAAGLALMVLLPITLDQLRQARASAAEAAAARRQVANILGGVREGLFLIGRDLRLGATCSDSLISLLRLTAPAGRHIEDVLRPLLDAETLAAALTFLQLLWNDEADEDAIESLNPLGQVGVSFANSGGERHYLSFSFKRVSGTRPAEDCILGVVADITDRVLLARELEQLEADGDTQAELLLQLLRTDPLTLVSFLDAADDAFRKSNAMLTASGIGQQQLRRKLSGVLRELDAVRIEAKALALASFAHRLQSIDEVLARLCAKTSLAGNDFLPIVVRLDELMTHAASMRAIQQHIVLLRAASAALAALEHSESTMISRPAVLALS
jgi:two-component system, chemotaxis family, sensor kinase CheA